MLKQYCIHWYHNSFKQTQMFKTMINTTENSPWHREINVGVHTDMVVSEYMSRRPNVWSKFDVLGFLTCVFHDVGKPISEILKHSDVRGDYKAYHGHELTSSRMWEDYIMSNKDLILDLYLDAHDIYGITWMIEHHVPWMTKDNKKLDNYAKTIYKIFNSENYKVFTDVLLSDTYGRISDDYDTKNNNSEAWVKDFNIRIGSLNIADDEESDKFMYMPIATSGTGKSTYYNTLSDVELYSWDNYRIEWYPSDDYYESWKMSTEDPKFKSKIQAEFIKLVRADKNVYVDNVNLSKKSRNFFLCEARRRGYTIIALVMPISVDELINRQENRTDKVISSEVYSGMYNRLQQPSYGEFDRIEVIL